MEKIKANLILEIMGRPPEHIKNALDLLFNKIASEKGVLILNKKIHPIKKVEKSKDLFVTFGEINVEFETLLSFFGILMAYMPSNVEVYEPSSLKLDSVKINEMTNYIVTKLHRYDEIAKRLLAQNNMLAKQLEHIKLGGKIEDIVQDDQKKRQS